MNQPPFTIRIRTEQEQDMDWMVQPNAISFHQALVCKFPFWYRFSHIVRISSMKVHAHLQDSSESTLTRHEIHAIVFHEVVMCVIYKNDFVIRYGLCQLTPYSIVMFWLIPSSCMPWIVQLVILHYWVSKGQGSSHGLAFTFVDFNFWVLFECVLLLFFFRK